MVPWGLGLGKRRELFRPCRVSSVAQPLFLSAFFSKTNSMRASFDQERERRAEARRFRAEEDRSLALLGSRIPRHMRFFTG